MAVVAAPSEPLRTRQRVKRQESLASPVHLIEWVEYDYLVGICVLWARLVCAVHRPRQI